MIDDKKSSTHSSGQHAEDDLFNNVNTSPSDENKPPTNSIALSTMLEPDSTGFISTDKLDEAFGNSSSKDKSEGPKSSGLSAPPRMRLKSNTSVGTAPVPLEGTPSVRPQPVMRLKPKAEQDEVKPSDPTVHAPSGLKVQENKSIRIVGSISTDNASVGQILQEARVCLELSLTQVEQQTKIKRTFLEAVERDDLKNLPAMCYVSAYIKTLCQLYRIDTETSAALLSTLKEKKGERTVPNEILQSLESDKHINFEEEAKVKKFATIAIVLILAIAGGIAYKFMGSDTAITEEDIPVAVVPQPTDGDSSIYFDEKELEKFIPNAKTYLQRMSSLTLEE